VRSVGFIGTGAMGSAIVARILDSGRGVVVTNRTRAHAADAERAGATWANDPLEVLARCDLVLACLRDSAAVAEVHGLLLEAVRPGQVVVEHGTCDPGLVVDLASAFRSRDALFLDAPVSGGPAGARAGRLVAMVGGEDSALSLVRPVLATYASTVVHVGASGAGQRLKLVNQVLVAIHMAGVAEALALARDMHLDLRLVVEVLGAGWGQSAMLQRTADQISGEVTNTGVSIAGMAEVLEVVEHAIAEHGGKAPVFDVARARFETALHAGAGSRDPAVLFSL
jgi:3-hydroxyisobutyrate dehydrogenase-like beta-hydroxyacid dehydrogenase